MNIFVKFISPDFSINFMLWHIILEKLEFFLATATKRVAIGALKSHIKQKNHLRLKKSQQHFLVDFIICFIKLPLKNSHSHEVWSLTSVKDKLSASQSSGRKDKNLIYLRFFTFLFYCKMKRSWKLIFRFFSSFWLLFYIPKKVSM